MTPEEQLTRISEIQAEHTLFLSSIVERLDRHTELLEAIETSLMLLAGNITNMRAELLGTKDKESEED
jgi:hypothetical protein